MENINFKNWNTSALTKWNKMFYGCKKLINLDVSDFDTSNVTDMSSMFYDCYALATLDVSSFNTSNVTNFSSTFTNCQALTSLDLSNFDFSKAISVSMFYNNYVLKDLQLGSNLGKGFTSKQNNAYNLEFAYCNQLTHDSLMDVINKVYDLNLTYDVANGGTLYTQKISFGSKNIAKLTSEEIAIATAKGWTVL
jgi:surface protein